jgi:ATP-binding cassette subfamily B multidrug efflux pump
MLRLAKYLKPFIVLILLAIVLLFIQANCDLALPDYLSRIVNVGIQQGGVGSAVPSAIRQGEMNKLVLFMSADDKTEVLGAYSLADKDSPDYDKLVMDYPALAKEPIYVLNPVGQVEIDKLNPVMGRAFLAVSGIEQMMADPSKAAAAGLGFDLSKLPAGVDVFALLGKLPAAQLAQMAEAVDKRFEAMGDSTPANCKAMRSFTLAP